MGTVVAQRKQETDEDLCFPLQRCLMFSMPCSPPCLAALAHLFSATKTNGLLELLLSHSQKVVNCFKPLGPTVVVGLYFGAVWCSGREGWGLGGSPAPGRGSAPSRRPCAAPSGPGAVRPRVLKAARPGRQPRGWGAGEWGATTTVSLRSASPTLWGTGRPR